MEILLTNSDLEQLIRKSYSGIESITFSNPKIKVTLKVDTDKFTQFAVKSATIVREPPQPPPKLTVEELNLKEKKEGIMASGGMSRTLVHVG